MELVLSYCWLCLGKTSHIKWKCADENVPTAILFDNGTITVWVIDTLHLLLQKFVI